MFRRHSETTSSQPTARGGVLFGPVVTGVLVAFGAMFLLSALIAGVIAALGYDDEIARGESFEIGAGAAIALIAAQLIAYMWGGYTAGRMSRGAGLANGLLVPLGAIVVALIVAAVAAMLGATTNLNLPFDEITLPIEGDLLIDWGPAVGISTLVAMFLGGALGGLMGARWHTKLERRVAEEERAEARDERTAGSDAGTTPVRTDSSDTAASDTTTGTTTTTPSPAPPAPETTGEPTSIRTEDGRQVHVGGETGAAETSDTSVIDKPSDHEPRR